MVLAPVLTVLALQMNAPSSCSHTVVFKDVILTATLMFKNIFFNNFKTTEA